METVNFVISLLIAVVVLLAGAVFVYVALLTVRGTKESTELKEDVAELKRRSTSIEEKVHLLVEAVVGITKILEKDKEGQQLATGLSKYLDKKKEEKEKKLNS